MGAVPETTIAKALTQAVDADSLVEDAREHLRKLAGSAMLLAGVGENMDDGLAGVDLEALIAAVSSSAAYCLGALDCATSQLETLRETLSEGEVVRDGDEGQVSA